MSEHLEELTVPLVPRTTTLLGTLALKNDGDKTPVENGSAVAYAQFHHMIGTRARAAHDLVVGFATEPMAHKIHLAPGEHGYSPH